MSWLFTSGGQSIHHSRMKWNISGLKLVRAVRKEGSCVEYSIATELSYPKVRVNKINTHIDKSKRSESGYQAISATFIVDINIRNMDQSSRYSISSYRKCLVTIYSSSIADLL